jgi:hypothetical protein
MRLFTTLIVLGFLMLFVSPLFGSPEPAMGEAAKQLPDKIGTFTATGAPSIPAHGFSEEGSLQDVVSHAARPYASPNGYTVTVFLTRTLTDSAAYALLTRSRSYSQSIRLGVIGTASIVGPRWVFFSKGNTFVKILANDTDDSHEDTLVGLASDLARGIDEGENDIPVLVKHLPNWQNAQPQARYAVSLDAVKQIVGNQPIVDVINFDGGAEAVEANYDNAQLVIVEFTTPQFAGDNDRRITAKISELRSPTQVVGTPVPSAYRRVGNYSVFVFNAPDEKTASELIDQVKYEQVVQWLGENPYWFEKAQRMYALKTAGVLVAVLQSSGLSLLLCLGIGGIFGFFLFRRRRAQQAAATYSDAGGMTRLNIDEMTTDHREQKLLVSDKS